MARTLFKALLTGLVLAAAVPARADGPSYNLAELLAFQVRPDSGGIRRGYVADGSVDFGSGFFGEASYSHISDDTLLGNHSTNYALFGPGYRVSFPLTDVFLSVDYLHADDKSPAGSRSGSGYRWVWGLRSSITERLEMNTGIEKSSVGNTDTGIRLGESYDFGKGWSLRAQYIWFSHARSMVLGLRYLY
jgi:hypothetical protein